MIEAAGGTTSRDVTGAVGTAGVDVTGAVGTAGMDVTGVFVETGTVAFLSGTIGFLMGTVAFSAHTRAYTAGGAVEQTSAVHDAASFNTGTVEVTVEDTVVVRRTREYRETTQLIAT